MFLQCFQVVLIQEIKQNLAFPRLGVFQKMKSVYQKMALDPL